MPLFIRDLDELTIRAIDASASRLRLSRQQFLHRFLTSSFNPDAVGTAKTAERLQAAFGGLEPSLFSLSQLSRACHLPDISQLEDTFAGRVPLTFHLSKQLNHLTGIHEDWLFDGRLTPFYQQALYNSPSEILHQGPYTLTDPHEGQPYKSLYMVLSEDSHNSKVALFAQSRSRPLRCYLLLRDVPFHDRTGTMGRIHLIDLACLAALLTSTEIQPRSHTYALWGRIYDKDLYQQIVDGNVHPFCLTVPGAVSSPWPDDIWDLEHPQRAYTSSYLSAFQVFKDAMRLEKITTNKTLARDLEENFLKQRQQLGEVSP